MLIVMNAGLILFIIYLIVINRKYILFIEHQSQQELNTLQRVCQDALHKKEHVLEERIRVECEAHKVFALYEIIREITKTFSPEEAFDIFKSKLRENIVFGDCLWLPPDTFQEEGFDLEEGAFLFSVWNDKEIIASLLFKKVAPQDKEKAMILSHQFALALRRVVLYQKVDQISILDSLTGVYSRRYLLERFEEEVLRAQTRKTQVSFLMMDVDLFKSFNDQYGHLTGDMILKEVGAVIKANIREIDIAGRYGGEEFCVVLPETDNAGALLAAERIRFAVENKPVKAYDNVVKVTLSAGVATFPVHGNVSAELIDKADWALYRAKKSGRNRACTFGIYEGKS